MRVLTKWRLTLPVNRIIQLLVIVFSGWILVFTSISASSKKSTECQLAMRKSSLLNAPDLWLGARACKMSGDNYSARFLFLSGRLRAMTDQGVLKPASNKDKMKLDEIYKQTFLLVNNLGDEAIYRDVELTNRLVTALKNWSPVLVESYDPGWKYIPNFNPLKYEAMVACQKVIRINAINFNASLARNDEYYEASKELKALKEKHSKSKIMRTTDLKKQYEQLLARIRGVNVKELQSTNKNKVEECESVNVGSDQPES